LAGTYSGSHLRAVTVPFGLQIGHLISNCVKRRAFVECEAAIYRTVVEALGDRFNSRSISAN